MDKDQILDDLESWLTRRYVCQLTNKNYNKFFVSLLAKLKRASAPDNLAEIVRSELTRSADVTTVWPSDNEFKAAWLSIPIYTKVSSRPERDDIASAGNENTYLKERGNKTSRYIEC